MSYVISLANIDFRDVDVDNPLIVAGVVELKANVSESLGIGLFYKYDFTKPFKNIDIYKESIGISMNIEF